MENAKATILAVGTDENLLKSRRALLQRAGFHVILSQNKVQARMASKYFTFETIVLCHSLDEAIQEQLERELGPLQRGVPVVKLIAHHCEPASLIHTVEESVGKYRAEHEQPPIPAHLIAESDRLIRKPGLSKQ